MLLLHPPPSIMLVATGSVTLANSRISAVANTAFVDFSVANVLTDYVTGHHYLILYDSTMKTLTGYIKAAGTGETLGSSIFADQSFDNAGSWTAEDDWSVAGGNAAKVVGAANRSLKDTALLSAGPSISVGELYNLQTVVSVITSGGIHIETPSSEFNSAATPSSYGMTSAATYNYYRTCVGVGVGGSHGLRANRACAATCASVNIRQVLTPSATGVTIVSTIGGTTQSWTSQTSGFAYNDASGFTYKIYRVRR
jgi:hypothetical protein